MRLLKIPLRTPDELDVAEIIANTFGDGVAVWPHSMHLVVIHELRSDVLSLLNYRRSRQPEGMYGRKWTDGERAERRAYVALWQRMVWMTLPPARRSAQMP